ncbi:ABC transporter substrate-binding protein [Bosea sp. (in: a-proteobacteria)]|uniref:ABC transporter substrate-binding protein n=1 Tax=Bosea sp. (in: a-proteobacteria) TaxID=1871050 RepID=UPI002FCB0F05
MKIAAKATIAIALTLALAGLGGQGAAAETLTVVTQGGQPGDVQRKTVFEPFTAETGTAIRLDTFNQELARIRTQVETGNLVWDAVSLNPINEAAGCEEGLLEKIDWSKHADAKAFEAVGGFGACGAPYLASPGALVYDSAKLTGDAAPKNWADFWNVAKFPGKRALMYQPDQTLEIALMADGVAPADVVKVLTGPGGVDRAFKKLAEIKQHVKWWKSGDESMQLLLTGEVAMGYGWLGRVNAANASNNRKLRIVWNAGYTNALIYFGVMKGSPRKEAAIKLIAYQLSAPVQARHMEQLGNPPANTAANPLLSEARRAALPDPASRDGMMQAGSTYINFWLDNGDAIRQRFATFVAQ